MRVSITAKKMPVKKKYGGWVQGRHARLIKLTKQTNCVSSLSTSTSENIEDTRCLELVTMTKGALLQIVSRSFFIHAVLNFRRMQNMGFLYAIVPLLRERKFSQNEEEDLVTRHLQMFNTHPYLSASLIGSIVRLEEDRPSFQDASSITGVKQSLMGPYAAIGDTFFWGALRPFAGICAALMAWMGWAFAPVAFMLIYMPASVWVRFKGFFESYRRGKQGIEFVRRIDLPRTAVRVRWFSLGVLAVCGFALLPKGYFEAAMYARLFWAPVALGIIWLCWFLIHKGVSQLYILYGVVVLLTLISLREYLIWWK